MISGRSWGSRPPVDSLSYLTTPLNSTLSVNISLVGVAFNLFGKSCEYIYACESWFPVSLRTKLHLAFTLKRDFGGKLDISRMNNGIMLQRSVEMSGLYSYESQPAL